MGTGCTRRQLHRQRQRAQLRRVQHHQQPHRHDHRHHHLRAWGGASSINYTLSASVGSGTYANRQVLNGSNVIAYNLYTTSADTSIWGDGNGDGTVTLSGTVTKQVGTVNLTIYGKINGGQNVVPGSYATTIPITVTLTYQ